MQAARPRVAATENRRENYWRYKRNIASIEEQPRSCLHSRPCRIGQLGDYSSCIMLRTNSHGSCRFGKMERARHLVQMAVPKCCARRHVRTQPSVLGADLEFKLPIAFIRLVRRRRTTPLHTQQSLQDGGQDGGRSNGRRSRRPQQIPSAH
ncbi:hypothetical protein IG631_02958 [Alternaria alternata]|nr:hypothetical protein IG631_02958 [Alternaria alternata]